LDSHTFLLKLVVLSAFTVKIAVFWYVMPCSLVEVYLDFRGYCVICHQCNWT